MKWIGIQAHTCNTFCIYNAHKNEFTCDFYVNFVASLQKSIDTITADVVYHLKTGPWLIFCNFCHFVHFYNNLTCLMNQICLINLP